MSASPRHKKRDTGPLNTLFVLYIITCVEKQERGGFSGSGFSFCFTGEMDTQRLLGGSIPSERITGYIQTDH